MLSSQSVRSAYDIEIRSRSFDYSELKWYHDMTKRTWDIQTLDISAQVSSVPFFKYFESNSYDISARLESFQPQSTGHFGPLDYSAVLI